MKKIALMLSIVFITNAFSFEQTYIHKDYDAAKSSNNYIKFMGESTKFGIVTTGFDGYVRKFTLSGDVIQNVLNNIKISFDVISLDTDNESRDEKMHDYVLEKDKFPQIKIDLPNPISLNKSQQIINAFLVLKNIRYPITLNCNIKRSGKTLQISGKSSFGIKNAKLPDPSIFIAKVRDRIDLSFNVEINEI